MVSGRQVALLKEGAVAITQRWSPCLQPFWVKDTEGSGKQPFIWDPTGSTWIYLDLIGLVAPLLLHCSATATVVLAAGDYFGENALLRDEPRSATILAKSELFTFRPMADGCRWLGGFHSGDQVPKQR